MDSINIKLTNSNLVSTETKVMKKIDFIIKTMPCITTQRDLQYLFEQLKSLQSPSIKWITK